MPGRVALDHALDLVRTPPLARKLRSLPLPDDVLQVLRIAAGDEQALATAAMQTGRSADSLRKAAIFYVVQIVLDSASDHYRILGAAPSATREELRAHMGWLLKWLHPDTTHGQPQAVFASRVIKAWEALKNTEQRQHYDALRKAKLTRPAKPHHHRKRGSFAIDQHRRMSPEARPSPATRRGALPRRAIIVVAFGLLVACGTIAAVVFSPNEMFVLGSTHEARADFLRPALPATAGSIPPSGPGDQP